MANKQYFPDLGKLSIAILESLVKPIVGDEAIKVLKKPLEEIELRNALANAFHETEKRFVEEYKDKEIGKAILGLPLADLPNLQGAVRNFYSRPSSSELQKLTEEQLTSDFPRWEGERIEKATKFYLLILREELAQISDEVRQKLVALAMLGIHEILYKQFAEAPVLSRHIPVQDFRTLIVERTRGFVGRGFLFEALDNLVKDSEFPSGYIIISGEPGIGKTTFMAELVKRHGYIHHFNLSLQNIRTARDFLSTICAQLIIHYELDHPTLHPDALKDSSFLSKLLDEVADKSKGQPTIILVDSLDEADTVGIAPGANILYLPPSLPKGVFFVLTTRETHDYRLVVDRQKEIYLRDDDPNNLDDVREYISNFIRENTGQMNVRFQEWDIQVDEFIEVITKKSEGNFMYLVHVLRDIYEGKLIVANMANIRNLPKGLKGYYQRHWRMMRAEDEDQFDKYQEPVVCILATVREPVTIEMVQEWTKLNPRQIKDVISQWREFLNVDDSGGDSLYRIYHTSFQDFLKDEVGLKKYHDKISVTALRKIPGFLNERADK